MEPAQIFCAEHKYITTWLDLIFELALDYALRQQTNISWQHSIEAAVHDRKLAVLVQNQYLKYKYVEIQQGKVILIDDFLVEQIQKDNEYVKTTRGSTQKAGGTTGKDSVLLSVMLPTDATEKIPAEIKNQNMQQLMASTNYKPIRELDQTSETQKMITTQKIQITQHTAMFNEHPIQRYLTDDRVRIQAAR